jgi:hypothetical protein
LKWDIRREKKDQLQGPEYRRKRSEGKGEVECSMLHLKELVED